MGQGEKIILRAFMLQEIEAEHTEKEKTMLWCGI